jgi:hypothetical protein
MNTHECQTSIESRTEAQRRNSSKLSKLAQAHQHQQHTQHSSNAAAASQPSSSIGTRNSKLWLELLREGDEQAREREEGEANVPGTRADHHGGHGGTRQGAAAPGQARPWRRHSTNPSWRP